MKKTFLKIFSFTFAFLFMFQLFGNILYAEEMQIKIDVVKKASEKKYFNDDQGYITHEVIDFDASKKEVNLELKVSNTNKSDEQKNVYDNTEVYLLVSENIANDSDTFAKKSANVITLAQKIINANKAAKVGIVGIKGTLYDGYIDENRSTSCWKK